MWQANWMSLGIIVTLFPCMVQRLASSMRPTIYISAASCRHIIVLPWKPKSYLPTSRTILWTNHEKGSFQIRSSVLLEMLDLSKTNCARPVLPGLLYFSSLEEFLPGASASHSRLELPPDCLLLTWHRWPGLCNHLGQLLGWWWWRWPPYPFAAALICSILVSASFFPCWGVTLVPAILEDN